MSLYPSISALVLAGGHSRRMGQDKALLIFEGEYLIQRIVRQLKPLFDEILVITGETKRHEELLDVPVLADVIMQKGPLGGLYTGLKICRHDWAFVIACDMPFVQPKIIERLINERGEAPIVAFEIGIYRTHMLALYHNSCLPEIKKRIISNELSLYGLFTALPVKLISEQEARRVDSELSSFVNWNRSEDLPKA
jgi:molybdopterin-guanine dinucleotide biosynthesis protein A